MLIDFEIKDGTFHLHVFQEWGEGLSTVYL